MHWNEFREENKFVEGELACPLSFSRDIPTKITLILHDHSHHLVPITKWAVNVLPTKNAACSWGLA